MSPKTATPTVSFSTLAKLMGPCTPVKQASLIRAHKYPTDGPKRSYQNARSQVIDHLVNQAPLNPGALREHERDAVQAFIASGYALPPGVAASRPTTRSPHWNFSGVDISVFPDVDLSSAAGLGALKVHFNKEALPRGVGPSMAALLHAYKTSVLGQTVSPRHCIIYEARTGALHACGGATSRLLSNVTAACQLITSLWPSL